MRKFKYFIRLIKKKTEKKLQQKSVNERRNVLKKTMKIFEKCFLINTAMCINISVDKHVRVYDS